MCMRTLEISSSSPSPRPAQPTPKALHQNCSILILTLSQCVVLPTQRYSQMALEALTSRAAASGAVNYRDERGNAARQLFDHCKDDPVRFSVLARPPHSLHGRSTLPSKSSGDYVSASSTSSYTASILPSAFTLSSMTDSSSASSALFDGQGSEDSGNSVFSVQLKQLYRNITDLEKIKQEDSIG